MIAIALCILAFGACYWAGKRSLGQGLVAVLVFGYLYGILRANLITSISHFIFDAGLIGLYLSPSWRRVSEEQKLRSKAMKFWMILLIAWPAILALLPFQPWLVSLVGLRGNTFFVPLLLLGSRLLEKDCFVLSVGIAVLDLVAFVFACGEYVLGVPRFFPFSPVTFIIYASIDAGGGFFRIPATFPTAHAFGATMVASIPYLIGLWTSAPKRFYRMLALASMGCALVGVLMSSTRVNFVLGCAMVTFFVFTAKVQTKYRVAFMMVIALVGVAGVQNVRFQRFKSLRDTDALTERIAGSVNRGFWEILSEYPMGNGLGGGGTSIPYFLQGQVRNPIGMENEYARILSEQGVIGLLLWLSFLGWALFKFRVAFAPDPRGTTRRLVWGLCMISFATAWIGTGLLTSIPGTLFLLMGLGWTTIPSARLAPAPERVRIALQRQPGWSAPRAG